MEGHEGRNILNGIGVLIHADIGQQVYELQEIVPLRPPVLKILRNRTKVLLVERYLHSLGLYLAERVLRVLSLVFLGLYFEPIAKDVLLVFEKMLKDDVLVFFEDAFFAADEGREEPEVFSGQFGCPLAVSLDVEALD